MNINQNDKPPWNFNITISKNIFIPSSDDVKINEFKIDNNIKYKIFKSPFESKYKFDKLKEVDFRTECKIIHDKHNKSLDSNFKKKIKHIKLLEDSLFDMGNSKQFIEFNFFDEAKKWNDGMNKIKKAEHIYVKSSVTEICKAISRIDNVIKTQKIVLKLSDIQKNIVFGWIKESINIYNFCIDKRKKDIKYFNKGVKAVKVGIFNELYKKNKPIPYDMATDVIRAFISNLSSCFTNLKNGNIKHFDMDKKSMNYSRHSLFIPHKSITKKGIYLTILGEIKDFKLNKPADVDSRLYYDKFTDRFSIHIPSYTRCKKIKNREPIVALDPGEAKFMAFYGLESHG